ncbi:hypothetical protein JCM8097_006039 [Rhodosporidiobolus ruineniae]
MPPVANKAAKADKPPPKDTPAGPKQARKRKLACIPCRERRVRCDWPEGGGGCLACSTARLRCPGEPAPKKRLKKGELPPRDGKPTEADLRMAKYQFGSAVTFHLIESCLQNANPVIPGMPYDFFRDFLKKAGGTREMEIAAEVFCGAFIAIAGAFSDHYMIVGKTDLNQPFDSPLGVQYNYSVYHPFGQKRRDAIDALSLNARQIFEDSGMRLRPSVEAIYALYIMDQMVVLTSERGRTEREYVQIACEHWKTMLGPKRNELTDEQVALLQGPVAMELLALDAHSAASLKAPLIVSDANLAAHVAHLSIVGAQTPTINAEMLQDEETGWTELGKQLAPLSLSTTALYRAFSRLSLSALSDPTTLAPFHTALDAGYAFLFQTAQTVANLPPLPEQIDTAWRAFDLFGLLNAYRRTLLRLDLLAHQRVIEALLRSQAPPSTALRPIAKGKNATLKEVVPQDLPAPPPQAPPPELLQAYAVSRQRVQRCFALAAELARHAIDTSSLLYARQLSETLEVCSSWTSMRNADRAMAAELCGELGITPEMGQIFLQFLSLCSWSTHSSFQLHQGLLSGLTALSGGVPPPSSPFPPPPSSIVINGRLIPQRPSAFAVVPPSIPGSQPKTGRKARRTAAAHQLAQQIAQAQAPPKEKVYRPPPREVPPDFVEDWSFLDAYGPPDKPGEAAPSIASGSTSAVTSPMASPPTPVFPSTSSALPTLPTTVASARSPPAPAVSSFPAPGAPTPSAADKGKGKEARNQALAAKWNPLMRSTTGVTASSSGSSSASSVSKTSSSASGSQQKKTQVQSRLEAAAMPLKFKMPSRLKMTPSIHPLLPPPKGQKQQRTMKSPPGPPLVPIAPAPNPPAQIPRPFTILPTPPQPQQNHYQLPLPPSSVPLSQAHPDAAVSAYLASPSQTYGFQHLPTPATNPSPPAPPLYTPSTHAAPAYPLPAPHPAAAPSPAHYMAPSPAPMHAQPLAAASFSRNFSPSSVYNQTFPTFPTSVPHHQPAPLPFLDNSSAHSVYSSYPPSALASTASLASVNTTGTTPPGAFPGTPTSLHPSFPVPSGIIDSTSHALELAPLDSQTLALLASLPPAHQDGMGTSTASPEGSGSASASGAGSVAGSAMGDVPMAVDPALLTGGGGGGMGGFDLGGMDWAMQGVEQPQHHQSPHMTHGGGWM